MQNFGIPLVIQINHMHHTTIASGVNKYFRVVKNSHKHSSCRIFKRQQMFDVFII